MKFATQEIDGMPIRTELELPDFEHIVTACHAVNKVKGPDHPLVNPTADSINLVDIIRSSVESITIKEPEAAEVIVDCLKVVAENDSDSYTNKARLMLLSAGLEAPDLVPSSETKKAPTTFSETDEEESRQKTSPSLVLDPRYVEIQKPREMKTALHAVRDFAPPVIRGKVEKVLLGDIEEIDPLQPQPSTYTAPLSGIIVECLEKSAQRSKTVYDDIATVMIEESQASDESLVPDEFKELTPRTLLKNVAGHLEFWMPSIPRGPLLLHQSR